MTYDYPFAAEEMLTAHDEWGCSCGPASLAFALQIPLAQVRGAIPGFEEKRFTTPTMMRQGLENLGRRFTGMSGHPDVLRMHMFGSAIALVRIQWEGPWTAKGVNPRWAYRHTHWVATWEDMREHGRDGEMRIRNLVFDCNGGIRDVASWESEIVPTILAGVPRADGGWFATHVWRIRA